MADTLTPSIIAAPISPLTPMVFRNVNSSTVAAGDNMEAVQYNDLRMDAISEIAGHTHEGTSTTGRKIPPASITPQGVGSGLDADTLDGSSNVVQVPTAGSLASLPTPGTVGRIYVPNDTMVLMVDDGTQWLYTNAVDPMWTAMHPSSTLNDPDAGTTVKGEVAVHTSGSGSVGKVSSDDQAMWLLATGTTVASEAVIRMPVESYGGSWFTVADYRSPIVLRGRMQFLSGDLAAIGTWFGLMGSLRRGDKAQGDFDNCILFRHQSNNWYARTANAGSVTETDTSITVSSWRKLEMLIDSTPRVRFYVDGTLVATHTDTIPLTLLRFSAYVYNYTTTEQKMLLSGLQFIHDRTHQGSGYTGD